MLQVERYERILGMLAGHDHITIEQIVDTLSVSRSTALRDLQSLEESRKLIRIRGGAVSIKAGTSHELPIEFRRDSHLEEKRRIAAAALNYIHDRYTVLLDSGTTILELAKLLSGFQSLMVATYDLFIVNVLADIPNIDLVVTGGVLRKKYNTLVGYFTEEIINQIHADIFFMGVDAIDMDHGCMNYSIEEIAIKKALIKSAKKVVVLCDHTKFENIAFMNTCRLSDIDMIITDNAVSPENLEMLRDQGVEVLVT